MADVAVADRARQLGTRFGREERRDLAELADELPQRRIGDVQRARAAALLFHPDGERLARHGCLRHLTVLLEIEDLQEPPTRWRERGHETNGRLFEIERRQR